MQFWKLLHKLWQHSLGSEECSVQRAATAGELLAGHKDKEGKKLRALRANYPGKQQKSSTESKIGVNLPQVSDKGGENQKKPAQLSPAQELLSMSGFCKSDHGVSHPWVPELWSGKQGAQMKCELLNCFGAQFSASHW